MWIFVSALRYFDDGAFSRWRFPCQEGKEGEGKALVLMLVLVYGYGYGGGVKEVEIRMGKLRVLNE